MHQYSYVMNMNDDDDNFYNYNKKQVAVNHLLSALFLPGDDNGWLHFLAQPLAETKAQS